MTPEEKVIITGLKWVKAREVMAGLKNSNVEEYRKAKLLLDWTTEKLHLALRSVEWDKQNG
jgi:hypothetical protein